MRDAVEHDQADETAHGHRRRGEYHWPQGLSGGSGGHPEHLTRTRVRAGAPFSQVAIPPRARPQTSGWRNRTANGAMVTTVWTSIFAETGMLKLSLSHSVYIRPL